MTIMAPMGLGLQGQSVLLNSLLPQSLLTKNFKQVNSFYEFKNSYHTTKLYSFPNKSRQGCRDLSEIWIGIDRMVLESLCIRFVHCL